MRQGDLVELAEGLFNESRDHGDLLVSTYPDKYDKLTHKVLCAYAWGRRFCPSATFLVKVDDDVLVNYYRLPAFLNEQIANCTDERPAWPKVIVGPENFNFRVVKDSSSKWSVAGLFLLPQ